MPSEPILKNQLEDQLRGEFASCLTALGAKPNARDLESLARLIVDAMSNANRSFHKTEHSVDLLLPGEPLLSLAALFHDTVYYQVDEGFPVPARDFLASMIRVENQNLHLKEDALEQQPGIALVCEIFNLKPGQKLDPLNGLNEFLSALLCEKYLSPLLPPKLVVQILACIEATIPFRSSVDGMTAAEALARNVSRCNDRFGLGLQKKEISDAVKRAVQLANRDVQNFASDDHAFFLATTWLLLPERNESLRGHLFTFADYRKSAQKMVGFFRFLTKDLVFKEFEGYPDPLTLMILKNAAAKNIAIARLYLDAKLVAIGVLEALASLTGGDLPIMQFLGEVKSAGQKQRRMEDYLPEIKAPHGSDPIILALLQFGRTLESNFDLRNSPLAAFLLRNLSQFQWDDVSKTCESYFAGKVTALEYLMRIPLNMITPIVLACQKSCPSRSEALQKVLSSLSENQIGR